MSMLANVYTFTFIKSNNGFLKQYAVIRSYKQQPFSLHTESSLLILFYL